VILKVVGEFGSSSAVEGVIERGVPAAGSGAGGAPTAPLPQELKNTVQQTDNSNAATCANGRCIFTGIPLSGLNQHSNNNAKVLATIESLSKRTGEIIFCACGVVHSLRPLLPSPGLSATLT